jgi:hypothetical protein
MGRIFETDWNIMLEQLTQRGERLAATRVAAIREQIIAALPGVLPPGIGVERDERGFILFGRRLKARIITDVRLRNIAAIAGGVLR